VTGPPDRDRADEPGIGLEWLAASDEAPLRTLAVIWATVELEQAVRAAGTPSVDVRAIEDPLLGARVVIAATTAAGDPVALAEPSTEGRLAATLARHGEGRAGRYVLAPMSIDTIRNRAAAAGRAVSRPAGGPFGPAVLVLGGPVEGPHLILVPGDPVAADRAAVPSRS
jgi:hypothetical protein